MSREAIFLGFHKKKIHLLSLTPSDLWQESYHIWYHLCPIIWKLLVHHSVSKSLCQMLSDLSTQSDCLKPLIWEQRLRFTRTASSPTSFWYSLGQYKDYTSDGHTAVSADCREPFLKQERPPVQILVQTVRPFRVKKMAYKGTANLHKP